MTDIIEQAIKRFHKKFVVQGEFYPYVRDMEIRESEKFLTSEIKTAINQTRESMKKELWEKAIRTQHEDSMMDWLDYLLTLLPTSTKKNE